MERTARDVAALRLDLLLYLVCMLFALASALWSEFYGYRVWGNVATVGYLLASAHTMWLSMAKPDGAGPAIFRSRWLPVGVVALLAVVVPLMVLVIRRSPTFVWGPWPWSWPAQTEVWVIERSASLLLEHGTPYTDVGALGRLPDEYDYTPYGPVMTIFGLPRALLGDGPLTDARLMFAAASVLIIVLALRLLDWPPIPVRAAHLAVVLPLTTLTMTVAGDDLPVIALIILAAALVYRANPVFAAIACALVVNMKLTALPALVVIAVAVAAYRGRRGLAIFLGAVITTSVIVVVPVLLVDPAAFVEHVIHFPAGLGQAKSPAESPLPGHLIAELGPAGHAVAIALLAIAACAITAWVLLRPPRTAADVMLRIATGLGAAIILAPATRWGYLVYPVAMLGAMIGFESATSSSSWWRPRARAA